ncbi:MAG: hypothetical protein ABI988_03300 [Nitrospirota bacterium]
MGTSSLQIDSLRNISPLIACRGLHEFDRTLNQELLKALKGDLTGFYLHSETAKTSAPVSTLLTNPNSPGYLKSRASTKIPLTFLRIEPYVVPKKSLTGENTERVDIRVLQIIYRFDRPPFPVYAGQQVGVFIERRPSNNTERTQPSSVPSPQEKGQRAPLPIVS